MSGIGRVVCSTTVFDVRRVVLCNRLSGVAWICLSRDGGGLGVGFRHVSSH